MADTIEAPIQTSQDNSLNDEAVSSREDNAGTVNGDSISHEKKSPRADLHFRPHEIINRNKDILSVIIMQCFILACAMMVVYFYSWLHNLPVPTSIFFGPIDSFRDAIVNFNFIGVDAAHPEPSVYAVILEAWLLSYLGVLARSAYTIRQSMQEENFNILEAVAKLFADSVMGISITIATVAFLRTTEFVNLSLKSADIGSIIAISFILGFYHENTRRLLGSFKKRISGSVVEEEEDEKKK